MADETRIGADTQAVGLEESDTGRPGPAKAPGSAVGSLVLGVVGVLTSFAVLPGLVCGVGAVMLARHAAARTGVDTARPGRGLAVAGQAMGGTALVLSAVVGGVFVLGGIGFWSGGGNTHGPQGSSQLRGIHQGMFTYANSNKEHFPGLDSKGNILPNSAEDTGNSGDGDTVQARYWIMFDGNFFTPEYAIAPRETDARITEYDPYLGATQHPVLFDSNTIHYSYAMLSINGTPGQLPDAADRASEWAQTTNSQAVVVSDRNTGRNATAAVQSIHTSSPGDWEGSILWNDNHVDHYTESHILETRYGNGPVHVDAHGDPNDNIFEPAGGDDAYLIHQGD